MRPPLSPKKKRKTRKLFEGGKKKKDMRKKERAKLEDRTFALSRPRAAVVVVIAVLVFVV